MSLPYVLFQAFLRMFWSRASTPLVFTCVYACVCVCSAMSDSLQPCGLKPASFLLPWDFPGKDTGLGCHFLLQRIFLTWGSLESLKSRDLLSPHWQAGSLPLCHLGSPDLYLPRKQKGDTPWSLDLGKMVGLWNLASIPCDPIPCDSIPFAVLLRW